LHILYYLVSTAFKIACKWFPLLTYVYRKENVDAITWAGIIVTSQSKTVINGFYWCLGRALYPVMFTSPNSVLHCLWPKLHPNYCVKPLYCCSGGAPTKILVIQIIVLSPYYTVVVEMLLKKFWSLIYKTLFIVHIPQKTMKWNFVEQVWLGAFLPSLTKKGIGCS
jgi:hypothetical protein